MKIRVTEPNQWTFAGIQNITIFLDVIAQASSMQLLSKHGEVVFEKE
jgi:hypothetical protein